MKDESAKIAAIVRIEGSRMSVKWDHLEAAAALDEECAKLRERVAELERERDAALAQLAACPVGPAQDAPDSMGWWVVVPGEQSRRRGSDIRMEFIRTADLSVLSEWRAIGATWYKLKVQP